MPPLTDRDRWIFAARCLFLFNILGKGCFGGYIFPRQELAFKQYTWFVHGCCWWTFHIPFEAYLTLIPIIFITSFVVQKRILGQISSFTA